MVSRWAARCMVGFFSCVAFLAIANIPTSAAGQWTGHRVDNITIQLPSGWLALSPPKVKQSPFRAAWYLGDEDEPDAGVAIFRPSFMPKVRKKLASYKYTDATVGGRPAKRYFVDFEGGGKSTSYVSIIAGAAPGGKDWALMHFAPTPKWAANQATLERVISSVRFGGSAPPPAPVKAAAGAAGYYQLDFLRRYNHKRPEGTFKLDGIPVSGYEGGNGYVVWLAKGKTPGDKKTIYPTSFSWPVPSYAAKEIMITTNLSWWDNNLRGKPVLRLIVQGSSGTRRFDLVVGKHTAEWNGGAITPAAGVKVVHGVPGPSRRWFIARFPLGYMTVTGVEVRLLDAARWGNQSAVAEIHGITLVGKGSPATGGGGSPASGGGSSAAPPSGGTPAAPPATVSAGSSGLRLFSAVKARATGKFAGSPANHLRIKTTAYNQVPYNMAPVFKGTVTRRPGQKAFLAGDAAGKAAWSVDNFILLTFSSPGGTKRIVVGNAEPVLLGGRVVPTHGPGKHSFEAGEVDLTDLLPENRPVTLTAEALDYGGVGNVSDVYLVLKGGAPVSGGTPPPTTTGSGFAQGGFGGSTYRAVLTPGGITWDQANAAAKKAGGHLAVITSKAENDFVYRLVGGDDRFWFIDSFKNGIGPWIGGYQAPGSPEPRGGWRWVTGEPWSFTAWARGEPNNSGGAEHHLHFFGSGTLKSPAWNDIGKSGKLKGYIIEFSKQRGVAPPVTTPTAKPNLRLEQPAYRAGQQIKVIFDRFPGNAKDWIAVTKADLPDNKYGQWVYLAGKKSGALNFRGLPAGSYQVRAYLNWPAGGYKVAARVGFTVTGATSSDVRPSLRIDQSSYSPGGQIKVTFTAPASYASNAWVGIIPSHVPHGKEAVNDRHDITYQYLRKRTTGVLFFKAPTKPGSYDLRMHDTDNGATGRETASVSFTVSGTASPPPTTAPPVTSPPVTSPPPTAPPITAPPVKTDYSRSVVIQPTKRVYRPDEPIVVKVSGLPAFPQMHVSIGPAGAPTLKTNQNIKTQARPEGTFTFKPRPVGKYRIIVWPDPNLMQYSILKTAPVEVKAPPMTATIEQPKEEYNTGQKRIRVVVRPDSLVFVPAVLVAVPRGAPSKLPDHSHVKFNKRFPGLKKLSMTVDAVVGFKPGQYEWRLYEPDTKGRIVARLPFSVVALGPDSKVPDDMGRLPFSDRFSPGAECWRTEGLNAVVKDYTLTVNTSRKALATAFSIPLENVSVFFKFKATGHTVRARWGAVKGQGYGLAIVPSQSGAATVYIYADGMAKSLARGQAALSAGAWHSVHLRRAGDDLQLRINGKMVAEAKTARRYKGGAPLVLQGGNPFTIKEAEVLYPTDAPHGGGYQQKDARYCRCGPRILENWLGGLQQNSWRVTSGQEPKLTYKFLKSETQISGPRLYKGIRMLRVKAEAEGKGSCRPPSVRAVFKVGKANSDTAYLETFVVLGLGDGPHNFPHILVELLDDHGKVLGSQRFYSPAAASKASRENAERRKYVKLTRSAGVVRLNLKDVKKGVEFSQVAVSLVNYVCKGDNDIAVDQILFCPSGDCGLTMTEVIDQAQVLAEIERLFVDFEITADELRNYYIVPPVVEPRPQPPLKPAGSSSLAPALYWDRQDMAQLPLREGAAPCCSRVAFSRTAATAGACDKAMDKAIKDMRRMQVSLGHDNQLQKALWELGKTLVKDLDLGQGGIKQVQEWVHWFMDEGEFAYDAYGDVKSGKAGQAVDKAVMRFSEKAFKYLHKKLLDECQKGLQLKKFSKEMRRSWAKSLMTLPPSQRRAELARLKHVFGARLSDDEFHRWVQDKLFDQVKDVDVGKAGGEAAGGEYKQALATIVGTAATAFSPNVRIAKAALKTYYESLRYMRDVITDDRTQDLYTAYREWYDTSRGGQGLFDAHAMRDRYPLHKVRTLLAKQKGTTHDKVSDDEAWKYLMKQFGKWREAEVKAEQQSDTLTMLRDRFKSLPSGCRRGLDKILWPQGKYGLTHEYRKRFDACYYDVEALKAYGQLYRDIMRDLKTWARPSMKCGGAKFFDDTTSRLACKFLTDGAEAYKRSLAHTLKSCDWLPKPKVVMLSANEARLAKRLTRMSETRLQVALRGIGQEKLLGCLCSQGVLMGVAGGYKPMPLPDSPACKKVSNGLCAVGNWGCYRFPVPMTAEAMKKCGVLEAIVKWQMERRKGKSAR